MEGNSASKLIIVLIVFGIALLLFLLWLTSMNNEDTLKEAECRESIRIHTLLVRSSGANADPDIKCEPHEKRVSGDQDTMRRAVADELLFCWQRWMNGEAELFVDEGTYCNPCSILTFSTKERSINGLNDFLQKESPTKGGLTYAEELFPLSTDGFSNEKQEVPELPILTDQTYAVVFYHDKNHSTKSLLDAVKEDPMKVVNAFDEAGGGVKAGALIFGIPTLIVGGVCTFISGGICAPVTAGSTLAATGVGAILGGALFGGRAVQDGLIYPEWFSFVMVIPHNGTTYRNLGCESIHQKGPAARTNGAENI